MSNLEQTARELQAIRRLPYGPARTAATEAITRRIEAEGPQEKLAEALLDLVEAYTLTNEGEKSFVQFAKLLRLYDAHPELFDPADQHNLFWEFKWVAGDLSDYPQITMEQARAFLADMGRRYDLAGHGRAAVAMCTFRWAWHVGDPAAEQLRRDWLATPPDGFEDCLACRIGQQVDYFTEHGRFDEAVALGATQQGHCNLEPTRSFHALAPAALNAGDAELATRTHHRARATMEPVTSDFAPARGQEFELLARGGNLDRALRRLRDDYPQLLTRASTPLFRLRFLIGVLAGLSANPDAAGLATGLREPGLGTAGELRAWALREATELARQFDQRSGTDYYAGQVARAAAAQPADVTLDLDVTISVPEPQAERPGAVSLDSWLAGSSEDAGETPAAPPETYATLAGRADSFAAASNHPEAVRAYARAAAAAEDEGLLAEAGIAWAEAAHCAQELHDDEAAHASYAKALPLLHAGGAGDDVIVPVLVAWAPSAATLDDTTAVLDEVEAALARLEHVRTEGLSDDLAAAHRANVAGLRAAALDTLARTIGAVPGARAPGRVCPRPSPLPPARGRSSPTPDASATPPIRSGWRAGCSERPPTPRVPSGRWSRPSRASRWPGSRSRGPRSPASSSSCCAPPVRTPAPRRSWPP